MDSKLMAKLKIYFAKVVIKLHLFHKIHDFFTVSILFYAIVKKILSNSQSNLQFYTHFRDYKTTHVSYVLNL